MDLGLFPWSPPGPGNHEPPLGLPLNPFLAGAQLPPSMSVTQSMTASIARRTMQDTRQLTIINQGLSVGQAGQLAISAGPPAEPDAPLPPPTEAPPAVPDAPPLPPSEAPPAEPEALSLPPISLPQQDIILLPHDPPIKHGDAGLNQPTATTGHPSQQAAVSAQPTYAVPVQSTPLPSCRHVIAALGSDRSGAPTTVPLTASELQSCQPFLVAHTPSTSLTGPPHPTVTSAARIGQIPPWRRGSYHPPT
jgi:hypothetical protein